MDYKRYQEIANGIKASGLTLKAALFHLYDNKEITGGESGCNDACNADEEIRMISNS